MTTTSRSLSAAAVLLLASFACSLPFFSDRPVSPNQEAAENREASAEVLTSATASSFQLPGEPPPPSGIIEAWQAGIDSGKWSYEGGLIESLKLFTGEATASGIYDEQPSDLEGFGIILEAQRYLEQGSDDSAKSEIERLLSIIAPPVERLMEYSTPEIVGWRPGNRLATLSNRALECEDLYADGFPPGSGIKCMLVKEGGMSGQTFRVFYPIAYALPVYAEAAYGAATVAWNQYSQLTPPGGVAVLKGIDIVFSLLNAQESGSVLAMVPSHSTDQRCLIVVYLPAIQANEQSKTFPDDFGKFAQTIAHEVFHCYQVWNFPEKADDKWSVQDWWGEGTAVYFSNVVYPEVNSEWKFLGGFIWNSADTSLVELSYENFAFFQYLGNTIGDNGILELVGKLPFGGDESSQAKALAEFPGMQGHFHDFGRASIDGSIADSGGGSLPTHPPLVLTDHQIEVEESQVRILDPEPFVLDRYAVRFPAGRDYTVTQALIGSAEGLDGARNVLATAAWGEIPELISAACGPVDYYVLVTSTTMAGGEYALELSMIPEGEVACDECLIGTWDLDSDSFQEYAEAPFADTPDLYQFLDAGGLWRYHFSADGRMSGEFDYAYGYMITQENEPLGTNMLLNGFLTIVGNSEGSYSTDGASNLAIGLDNSGVQFKHDLFLNGQQMAQGPLKFPWAGQGISSSTYSCDDEAGELLINFEPELNFPPLRFDRRSKSP